MDSEFVRAAMHSAAGQGLKFPSPEFEQHVAGYLGQIEGTAPDRTADATERAATALERIASALERFWPVYVTPSPVPNYTPPYIVPAFPTSPTTQPYVPNNGNTVVLSPSTPIPIQSFLTGGDAGAGVSEPYPTHPAPVDLSGESDLANYKSHLPRAESPDTFFGWVKEAWKQNGMDRARGCSGDPA